MPGLEAVKGKENIVRTTQGMDATELKELTDSLDKTTTRSTLNVILSQPITKAKRIIAPFLVILPELDNQTPLQSAKKAAKLAAEGDLVKVEGDHFDLYYSCVGYDDNIRA